VATNPAETCSKIDNALITARGYRWDRVAASFLGLYEDLIRERAKEGQPKLPAFYSTTAGAVRASVIRGAANLAITAFRFCSRFAWTKTAKPATGVNPAMVLRRGSGGENEQMPA
jgi:hypothetical protein